MVLFNLSQMTALHTLVSSYSSNYSFSLPCYSSRRTLIARLWWENELPVKCMFSSLNTIVHLNSHIFNGKKISRLILYNYISLVQPGVLCIRSTFQLWYLASIACWLVLWLWSQTSGRHKVQESNSISECTGAQNGRAWECACNPSFIFLQSPLIQTGILMEKCFYGLHKHQDRSLLHLRP